MLGRGCGVEGKSVIAIDGPAGAGKSTVARRVAAALGYLYIDTGAMYRAVTLAALERGVDPGDADALAELARSCRIELRPAGGGRVAVELDGRDVSELVRSPAVDEAVSTVAAVPGVREALVEQQRRLAGRRGVVMDGRDIGTHVLPDADCKIFLTAGVEERARRRAAELHARGFAADVGEVRAELERRDRLDSEREVAPLRRAPDAHLIDSTGKTIDEVVADILEYCRRR